MKTEEFDKCREFLEKAIIDNPENNGFLQTYQKLIELKSIYDKEIDKVQIEKQIRDTELSTQYHTDINTSNIEYKKSIYQNDTDYHIAVNNKSMRNFQNQ